MAIEVTSDVIEVIEAEARDAYPRECCGILLGKGVSITHMQPTSNIHSEPETHFEIEPQALINAHRAAREGGLQVLGYYHSHPTGKAEPSATDRKLSACDGSIWAIATKDEVRFWRDDPGGFIELSYAVQNS